MIQFHYSIYYSLYISVWYPVQDIINQFFRTDVAIVIILLHIVFEQNTDPVSNYGITTVTVCSPMFTGEILPYLGVRTSSLDLENSPPL